MSDTLSTLEKIRGGQLHSDWTTHINYSQISKISLIFCPGHTVIAGKKKVDKLVGEAAISTNKVLLETQTIVKMIFEDLSDSCESSFSSLTLQGVKDSGT